MHFVAPQTNSLALFLSGPSVLLGGNGEPISGERQGGEGIFRGVSDASHAVCSVNLAAAQWPG